MLTASDDLFAELSRCSKCVNAATDTDALAKCGNGELPASLTAVAIGGIVLGALCVLGAGVVLVRSCRQRRAADVQPGQLKWRPEEADRANRAEKEARDEALQVGGAKVEKANPLFVPKGAIANGKGGSKPAAQDKKGVFSWATLGHKPTFVDKRFRISGLV